MNLDLLIGIMVIIIMCLFVAAYIFTESINTAMIVGIVGVGLFIIIGGIILTKKNTEVIEIKDFYINDHYVNVVKNKEHVSEDDILSVHNDNVEIFYTLDNNEQPYAELDMSCMSLSDDNDILECRIYTYKEKKNEQADTGDKIYTKTIKVVDYIISNDSVVLVYTNEKGKTDTYILNKDIVIMQNSSSDVCYAELDIIGTGDIVSCKLFKLEEE